MKKIPATKLKKEEVEEIIAVIVFALLLIGGIIVLWGDTDKN